LLYFWIKDLLETALKSREKKESFGLTYKKTPQSLFHYSNSKFKENKFKEKKIRLVAYARWARPN